MSDERWQVGETVIRYGGGRREETVCTVDRVTPSGRAVLAGDAAQYLPNGRMVGSGSRFYGSTRIRRPKNAADVGAIGTAAALREARGAVRAALEGQWDALTLEQCRAIIAAAKGEADRG